MNVYFIHLGTLEQDVEENSFQEIWIPAALEPIPTGTSTLAGAVSVTYTNIYLIRECCTDMKWEFLKCNLVISLCWMTLNSIKLHQMTRVAEIYSAILKYTLLQRCLFLISAMGASSNPCSDTFCGFSPWVRDRGPERCQLHPQEQVHHQGLPHRPLLLPAAALPLLLQLPAGSGPQRAGTSPLNKLVV